MVECCDLSIIIQCNKYDFQGSDNSTPWYQQITPTAVLEHEKAKITWLEQAHGLKTALTSLVQDKEHNTWILIQGKVCQVGKIKYKTSLKQEKYKDLHKTIQESVKGILPICYWQILLEGHSIGNSL